MSADIPRVGLIGCGIIARAYARALEDTAELQLVAAADTDGAAVSRMSQATGLPCHSSVQDLLDREELDAALVLTPPDTHEPISCKLLEAGLHVLCEKPLAPNIYAAERMFDAAERADRMLMMGSKFRYVEDVDNARSLLDEGLIGEVLLFENVFCSRVDMSSRWNSVRSVAGGGVLIDNGCHSVDIARFLLGPITRVQAQFGKQVQPIEVEDTARLLFQVESGTMGSVDLSWSLHKEVTSYVRLYGSEGTLEIGWKRSRYKLGGDGWIDFGDGYDKLAALRRQLRNFGGSILGTENPTITAQDALSSVAVVDAAYRSALDHKWSDIA